MTIEAAAFDDAIAIVNALRSDDHDAVATVVAHASDPGHTASILLTASLAPMRYSGAFAGDREALARSVREALDCELGDES